MAAADPIERKLISRSGGYARAAKHDSRTVLEPARQAWVSKWEREVDPSLELDPAERARRAKAAMRAYMTELARRSARARRKRAEK